MKRFRRLFCMILAVTMIAATGGCGGNTQGKSLNERAEELNRENGIADNNLVSDNDTDSGPVVTVVSPAAVATDAAIEEDPSVVPEGKTRSLITGSLIDDKYENVRPYAFMFNNIRNAYPQTGTGRAGVLYEILAEGGITRLMGIFDNMKGDRIGSARSARHYYVDFANEYDAIYIHYGQTKYATAEIKKLGIDELSGLAAEGSTVFYRDYSIPAPHNAFASADGIAKGTKNKNISTKLRDGIESHFNFVYDKTVDNKMDDSNKAAKVTLPFSAYMTPYFTYNKKTGKYTRYAFGTVHKDRGTGKALTFKNLFVQFVNEYNIDHNGYQTMDLINNNGSGYYITNGRAIKVYWKKGNANSKTAFFYDKGFTKEVEVNPGKTYYAVFPKDRANMVTFE